MTDAVPSTRVSGPSPPPLPELSGGDFLDESQWKVLYALADTILPSIVPESGATDLTTQKVLSEAKLAEIYARIRSTMVEPPDEELFRKYLAERPSTSPAWQANLRQTVNGLPTKSKKQLRDLAKALSTWVGSLLLTHSCKPLHEQSLQARHAIIKAWADSWFPGVDMFAVAFAKLTITSWVQTSPVFKEATGYQDVHPDWKPGQHHDYSFLKFGPGKGGEPEVLETDVVIVGSGCGGAVAAKVLAEAGHQVLVVDKGYYFPPEQLPMPQAQGFRYLFENRGVMATVDSSVSVVAGSCWGGGGTINWSVCLEPQGFVRDEWAGPENGLTFFKTQAFKDCLDRVGAFMGVSDQGFDHSHKARQILDGADKLGWHAQVAPQNSGGDPHWCGHCTLGCASAEKQGTIVTWLPAAARAGAQFIEGFEVQNVTFDEAGAGKRRATGIRGRWTSRDADGGVSTSVDKRTVRDVVVKAKKVIVSAGSLQSPLLLMRSGLTNRHIGKHLHLHPSGFVSAFWPEDIRPWEGGIITAISGEFEKLDGKAYGVKLESTCMLPYTSLSSVPWRDGLDYKLTALRFRHMNSFISITRDRDTGTVFPDAVTGAPCIEYSPSAFDRRHTLAGMLALAQLCYVQGAEEIRINIPGSEPFFRKKKGGSANAAAGCDQGRADQMELGVADPEFQAWLDGVEKIGIGHPASFGSAHQMGTCRMSSHEGAGAVDPRGRTWEAWDLYVADASVFPSATGVNPMITVMAIADWIARSVGKELKAEADAAAVGASG